ncbi:MAG: hypothetical protein ACOYMN_16605, partial [Roseimicrobium sp.]
MKTTLLHRRLFRQQGTVLVNMLCALGGAVIGGVITFVGCGLLAAFVLPTISNADRVAESATERAADRSHTRKASTQSMTPR